MRHLLPLLAVLTLSACVDPQLGVGMTIGANGVSIAPSASAGLPGGGRVTISP